LYKTPFGFEEAVKRPELTMYRAIIAHRDLNIWSSTGVPVLVPHVPTAIVRAFAGTGMSDRAQSITYNKGLPLQPYENQYIDHAHTRLAVKRDGVMAKLVYSSKALELKAEDGKSYQVQGFKSDYCLDFILQVELVPVSSGFDYHAVHDTVGVWMVVTDVLLPPWGATGSFISRWKWLQEIYSLNDWPFVLQEWVAMSDPRVLELIGTASEGVVVQNLLAPPNAIKDGAGTARYVKRVWTIDIKEGKGVINEVTLDGKFVRPRPDKTRANPQCVIDAVRTAVDYDVFCVYVLTKFFCTPGSSWTRLIDNISSRRAPKEWSVHELVLFFANRYNNVLLKVAPTYMRFLNESYANYCSQQAIKLDALLNKPLHVIMDSDSDDYKGAYSVDRGPRRAEPVVVYPEREPAWEHELTKYVSYDLAPVVDAITLNNWPDLNFQHIKYYLDNID